MTSQGYRLTSELDEGLKKYGRDNNISPTFILNELVESFLIDKGYLSIKPSIKNDNTPKKIKYAPFDKYRNRYFIVKWIKGKRYNYASVTQGAGLAEELVQFLESKNWDIKYSTKSTGLKGTEQINFLLSEMEKEKENGYDGM